METRVTQIIIYTSCQTASQRLLPTQHVRLQGIRIAPKNSTFGASAYNVVYHVDMFFSAIAQRNSGCQAKERMIHCFRLVGHFICSLYYMSRSGESEEQK